MQVADGELHQIAFAFAGFAAFEDHGHFLDGGVGAAGDQLDEEFLHDIEIVGIQVKRAEGVAAVKPEAIGDVAGVELEGNAEGEIDRERHGDEDERVFRNAAVDVARADHDQEMFAFGPETFEINGIVGAIGIHEDDVLAVGFGDAGADGVAIVIAAAAVDVADGFGRRRLRRCGQWAVRYRARGFRNPG